MAISLAFLLTTTTLRVNLSVTKVKMSNLLLKALTTTNANNYLIIKATAIATATKTSIIIKATTIMTTTTFLTIAPTNSTKPTNYIIIKK